MAEEHTFECPSCGGKLATDGTQVQITCDYCGNIVIVPQDLRAKPAAPVQASIGKEQLAEAFIKLAGAAEAVREELTPAQTPARSVRPARRGGCGCLLPLLLLAALALVASGLIPGVELPPQVREVLGIVSRASKQEAVDRPLQGTLPRTVRYAGLDFKVNAATVTNRTPDSTSETPRYRMDRAYAELDLLITNSLTTKAIYLGNDIARLELADGKSYPESNGWSDRFDKQASSEARLIFTVPYTATLKDAKLILQEPGKEPATLPLDGPAPEARYPVKLAGGGHATVGKVNYTVLSAMLDLDADGQRAEAGKRFLLLKMRVENTSDFAGGMALGANHFRLLVDGAPRAPDAFPNTLINAKSAVDGEVVFVLPNAAVKADLQVGEVGYEQPATIPIRLQGIQ